MMGIEWIEAAGAHREVGSPRHLATGMCVPSPH
jgi:hypothetical protein